MTIDESILEHKEQLLSSKSGDSFVVPFYLQGWRTCEISMGYKKGKVKPLEGSRSYSYTAKKLKEELKETYWFAARNDATVEAWARGRKKRPKNWEDNYR